MKKSEADAKGNCPVMARLIVGKYSETAFSVKLRVPQSLWLSGRACGKSAAARDINNRLDEIRAAAFSIYAEQSANREVVTAEEVKHQLLGMASEQETLLSYFRLFMRNFEKRVGINRTESSLNGYRNSYDHLVRFLQSQYKLSDIPFAALDRSFIGKIRFAFAYGMSFGSRNDCKSYCKAENNCRRSDCGRYHYSVSFCGL